MNTLYTVGMAAVVIGVIGLVAGFLGLVAILWRQLIIIEEYGDKVMPKRRYW